MGAARPTQLERTERVWDLITVGVMLIIAALSFVWFLPQ